MLYAASIDLIAAKSLRGCIQNKNVTHKFGMVIHEESAAREHTAKTGCSSSTLAAPAAKYIKVGVVLTMVCIFPFVKLSATMNKCVHDNQQKHNILGHANCSDP